MSKKSHFRGYFGERHDGRQQGELKSGWQDLDHSHWSLLKILGWKKSLLMVCKVLKLFVNALTARDKYSLRNRDNLTQPIQRELSQKQESFSGFFFAFLKSTWSFKHFRKKEDTHSWWISEIMDSEKRAEINV